MSQNIYVLVGLVTQW